MMRYLGWTLVLALIAYSCHTKTDTNTSINGSWASLGSGLLLEIKDSTSYSFYDETSISCLPSRAGSLGELQASLKRDTLTLTEGVLVYKFTRTNELRALCYSTLEESKKEDPLYNFDVFSETVEDHYAFLELNNINWDQLYKKQRAKLSEASTDAELYLLIEETLEELNDNHAYLEATEEVYVELDKLESPEEEAPQSVLPEYGDLPVAQMVADHHLEEEMTDDSWLIQWGRLTDDIGYIQVKTMWLYVDLDLPELLVEDKGFVDAYIETRHKLYEGVYVKKEVESVGRIMDRVMRDLSSMRSIVIDVRFNGGGQDAVSFEILSRFGDQKQQVAKQKFRYGNKFTADVPIYMNASKGGFTKPVYVLTSPVSGSAAEAFSIGSMALQNVKRIGGATMGATSTTLDKTLPNGWIFSISNEVYMDIDGNNYENIGVPVDYELDYPRDRQSFFRSVVDDLEGDKENILSAIRAIDAD